MDRRLFLQGLASTVAMPGLRTTLAAVGAGAAFLTPERASTFQELLVGSPSDAADRYLSYLQNVDLSDWHAEIHPVLKTVVPQLLHSQRGIIVELGSFKGASRQVLKEVFPTTRVISLDVKRYYEDPDLRTNDIRANPLKAQPIMVGWNDISNWSNSPRSRLAAFNYLTKNLVRGGLYIDDAFASLPKDLDLSGLELVYAKGYVSVFRKA